MSHSDLAAGAARTGMGFKEFVAFIAAVMATNALAIDTMLPALPLIGRALHIAHENDRQWIVTAYLLGFGVAQLVYGTLADRYGRRPVLFVALALYALFSVFAGMADSLHTMLIARVLQGIGAAGTRVLAVSIVRDRYAGRQMARVMSLAFLVFFAVPVAAPSIGQLVMLVEPWRAVFHLLALFGAAVAVWGAVRLPETLHESDRLRIEIARIAAAFRECVSDRKAVGYTFAQAILFGGLLGYINAAQQIFTDVYHVPSRFPILFGCTAAFLAAASLLNARIVGRLGMHRVSHAALFGYVAVAASHVAIARLGGDTLWVFAGAQALILFCIGLIGPNFGALAMESMGHVAGTASSLQGFVTSVGGALVGFAIGQQFDGTTLPICVGYLVVALSALAIVIATEGGRLFHSTAPAATVDVP